MPKFFSRRRILMGAGFLCALVGDVFLAVLASPVKSAGFLAGVAAFSCAHVFWMAAQFREARPAGADVLALGVPLAVLTGVRLFPVLPVPQGCALVVYALLSALSFAVACATRRVFYSVGIGLLLFSDTMIAMRILRVPGCGVLVGPTYILAMILLLASWAWAREPRRADGMPTRTILCGALFAGLCFLLAMALFPGGGYNPCFRMLSALGRTVIRDVVYPWCHVLFTVGLCLSAALLFRLWPALARAETCRWRQRCLRWGGSLNVAGLATIALAPENVTWLFHNLGCWMAVLGGLAALFARDRPGPAHLCTIVLGVIGGAFGLSVGLHALKILPFAPFVPTLQKVVIVAFALWAIGLARPFATRRTGVSPVDAR